VLRLLSERAQAAHATFTRRFTNGGATRHTTADFLRGTHTHTAHTPQRLQRRRSGSFDPRCLGRRRLYHSPLVLSHSHTAQRQQSTQYPWGAQKKDAPRAHHVMC
jgi:hypothetical protein